MTQPQTTLEELRTSETRYRRLFETARDGILILNAVTLEITDANPFMTELLGYSRGEFLGKELREIGLFSDKEASQTAFRTLQETGYLRYEDLPLQTRHGQSRQVEFVSNVYEEDGQEVIQCNVRDITERDRLEVTHQEIEGRYRTLFDQAPDGIVIADQKSYYIDANASMCRMLGYSRAELIGLHASDIVVPAEIGHIEQALNLINAKSEYYREWQFRRQDGSVFVGEVTATMMPDGNLLAIIRQITERRRSEEANREQARILDLAPVLIRDLDGRILFWNSGAEQLYGWSSAEALGRTKHSLLRTEFPYPLKEIRNTLFADGHWQGELVHAKKNGERIVVLSHWVLHKDANNEPKAILEINNDITERRRAEREILRLNQELEQRVADRTAQLQAANKELEAFSYSVSHDLRAPLRHINGFSQALLEDYADKLDEVGKGYLQEVRGASHEMGQLIDDMLQLARVTRSEMHQEVINLSELAYSIVAELQKGDAGRTVAVDIQGGLSTRGDKRLLRIMLGNLIGNSWKFTSKWEHAEISFGQAQQGAELVYFVRDNGAGFDMTYVDKLFGAFQRLHGAGEFEGTGIGLATVQRIVHRHGGRAWGNGAVNQGATFYFTLANLKETENGNQSDLTG